MANPYPTYVFTPVLSPKTTETFGTKTNQSTMGVQKPSVVQGGTDMTTQTASLKTISTWLPAGIAPNAVLPNTDGTLTLHGKEAVTFDALYGSSGLNLFTKTQS
jgi:hypothetical protein